MSKTNRTGSQLSKVLSSIPGAPLETLGEGARWVADWLEDVRHVPVPAGIFGWSPDRDHRIFARLPDWQNIFRTSPSQKSLFLPLPQDFPAPGIRVIIRIGFAELFAEWKEFVRSFGEI